MNSFRDEVVNWNITSDTEDNLTEKKKTTDSTDSKRIKKKVIETLSGYKYKLIYYYYIQYILCLYI